MTKPLHVSRTEATMANMPELTGTEKQIAWADNIRVKAVSEVENLFLCCYAKAEKAGKDTAQVDAQYQQLIDALSSQTDAAWWIDNRHGLEQRASIVKLLHAQGLIGA